MHLKIKNEPVKESVSNVCRGAIGVARLLARYAKTIIADT
jgi:hypothetical protein